MMGTKNIQKVGKVLVSTNKHFVLAGWQHDSDVIGEPEELSSHTSIASTNMRSNGVSNICGIKTYFRSRNTVTVVIRP